MKALNVAVMIVAAAGIGWAGEKIPARERKVTVCIDPGAYALQVKDAQQLASRLFATIGVKIEWHERHFCPAGGNAVQVRLSDRTPDYQLPGSLAYALPYEGSEIVLFYDRIRIANASLVTCLTAYVLVHEITHILEGVDRHSAEGIMKAHWDRVDRFAMQLGRLSFSPVDVDLISRGLDKRESPNAVATTPVAAER